MSSFRDRPIRQKLLRILVATSAIAILAATVAVLIYETTTFRPHVLADLEVEADLVRSAVEAALSFDDAEAATESLATLRARREISAACVYRADGTILARYRRAGGEDFDFPSAPGETGHRFEARQLVLIRAVVAEGDILGHLLLRRDLPSLLARLPQYGIMIGVVLVALSTLSTMLFHALEGVVARPLRELAEAVEEVDRRGNYRLGLEPRSGDEIGHLTASFGRLLSTIEQRESALREVNADLEQSERFNQQVSDSMPSLLYVLDLRERRLTHVNRQAERILGYARPELLAMGTEAFEIFAAGEPDPHSREEIRREEGSDGDVVESELLIHHAGGEQRWLATRETVFQRASDGDPVQILGIAQDITEQKLLREQLLQAQKMESIGRLAGGVAHDFNNLLTVIVGSAELAGQQLAEDHPSQRHVRNISEATRQATDLTRQLLAFARKQVIEPRVLDLGRLVRDSEKMLRSLIGDDIELATASDTDLWSTRADPGQMMQVLVNLAVNARDAMADGGKLRIETHNVSLHNEVLRGQPRPISGEFVQLLVRDTGIGMTGEAIEHLFEPFFTTKEVGHGTGLGLATCYGIVQQSGGHIAVESTLGLGTSFAIYLRRVRGPVDAVRTEPAARAHLPRGRETLMIVEDNSMVRRTTVRLLTAWGYEILEAASGPDAIRKIGDDLGRIDLLISDIVMPRMSGRELAAHLREARPDLKVLFISGYAHEMTERHGGVLEEGFFFLQKPFTSEALSRKVRAILES